MQATLFDAGTPSLDLTFRRARLLHLRGDAWVEHVPRWLSGHESVFRALRDGTSWNHGRRQMYERVVDVPRLTARIPRDGDGHPVLHEAADALHRRYSRDVSSLSLACYRDGRDSVAMHGDKVGEDRKDDTLIGIVSVGAPRRFLLKPASGGPSIPFALGWGDLLVMGGACQRTWVHGVPKVSQAAPRISIMFREPRAD